MTDVSSWPSEELRVLRALALRDRELCLAQTAVGSPVLVICGISFTDIAPGTAVFPMVAAALERRGEIEIVSFGNDLPRWAITDKGRQRLAEEDDE